MVWGHCGLAGGVSAEAFHAHDCTFHKAGLHELQAVGLAAACQEQFLGNPSTLNRVKLVQLWDDVCFDHGPTAMTLKPARLASKESPAEPEKNSTK